MGYTPPPPWPKPPDPLIAHIGQWYDRLLGSLDDSDLRDQVFAAYGEWLEAPKRTIPDELWDSLQSSGIPILHPITQFAPAPPDGRYSLRL
jgi:hypothetical protein